MYAVSAAAINYNSDDGELNADSIILTPRHSKYGFSRVKGYQKDRINVLVPSTLVQGLYLPDIRDTVITASSITLRSAVVHVFRDKRLPFFREGTMALPMTALERLPASIAVDSIFLKEANITYEEFAEEGFQTGAVTFEHVNAKMGYLCNHQYFTGRKQADLAVTAQVMGRGALEAAFTLPYDTTASYHAKGNVRDLEMSLLNPIVENLLFTRISSGKLNALYFDFDYNDYKSTGSILLNYEDLKVEALKKQKRRERNELKSAFLNVLLKKTKDRDVAQEKRTGTIDFDRNRKRAIFHYWWKSLQSGLASSVVNLG
jgi:hypothetical protein